MKKTFLVSIIAIVLVISFVGTCFALSKYKPQDRTVGITATVGSTCTLTITDGNNGSVNLDFSGISPTNRTKSVDLQLSTTNNALADGVHGIFKVFVTGDLADYIDISATEIASIGDTNAGTLNENVTKSSGADITLSTLPKYFRITMYLNNAGYDGFASIAEKTSTITASWTINQNSVFSYDANAYYVVGTLNGVTYWYPTDLSIVLDGAPQGEDQAYKAAVQLHEGDCFKVVKNYKSSPIWFGGKAENASVDGVSVSDPDGSGYKINITKDGTYYFFIGTDNRVWVDVQDYH